MIHNRNAQAAMLVTAIGVTAVIGWIVVASLVFDGGPTNLAADILSGAGSGDGQVRKIVVDGAKIPLIHDVSMSITRACWTRSRLSATASTILPGGPERRFLMVDYEITNESNRTISFEGFVNLFNIVRGAAVVATGGDDEAGKGSTVRQYGIESNVQAPLEIPPMEIFDGAWYFELDSRQSDLRLRSGPVGVALNLPVDLNHPLAN